MDEGAALTIQTNVSIARIGGLLSLLTLIVSGMTTAGHWTGAPCLIRRACHIPCPGCGLTRSFAALWHGDVPASLRYHPLGLPLFIGLIACVGVWALSGNRPAAGRMAERWEREMTRPRLWLLLLALWLGTWLLRLAWARASGSGYGW